MPRRACAVGGWRCAGGGAGGAGAPAAWCLHPLCTMHSWHSPAPLPLRLPHPHLQARRPTTSRRGSSTKPMPKRWRPAGRRAVSWAGGHRSRPARAPCPCCAACLPARPPAMPARREAGAGVELACAPALERVRLRCGWVAVCGRGRRRCWRACCLVPPPPSPPCTLGATRHTHHPRPPPGPPAAAGAACVAKEKGIHAPGSDARQRGGELGWGAGLGAACRLAPPPLPPHCCLEPSSHQGLWRAAQPACACASCAGTARYLPRPSSPSRRRLPACPLRAALERRPPPPYPPPQHPPPARFLPPACSS